MLGANWGWVVLAAGVFAAAPALAQQPGAAASTGFRAGEAFTFLFLAMGPNPIIRSSPR